LKFFDKQLIIVRYFCGDYMKLFITSLLILLTLFAVSCSDAQSGNEVVLKITPTKLNFKTISVGDTEVQYFTLKNNGRGDLKIESIKVIKNSGVYKIKNDLKYPIVIPEGKKYNEEIEVEYTAKDMEGDVSGKIEVISNDSFDKAKTVYLSAEKANPSIKVSVETVIFNKLNINEAEEFDLIVYNVGTSALKFEKFDDDGNLVATNKDAFIFGNGTSNSFELVDLENVRTLEPVKFENGNEIFDFFKIKIKYTANGEGTETGTLKIYNNSTNSSPLKIINIMASSESCDLILQPRDGFIDFGERPQGSVNNFTVLLANKGAHDCELRKVELDSENTSVEFSLELPEDTEFPVIIKATERFQFKVVFKPTEETGTGGATGVVKLEANDERWNGGKKQLTLSGRSKEDNSPVCILKNLHGGEPYFEVEPGQREAVECNGAAVCSNIQMISESYDPNPDNSGNLTHTWRMVESPAAYSNPAWISFPDKDPNNVNNRSDHHYVDFYVPYATPPGTKYLVELTVTSESGLSSQCYGEIRGLTGNSLHVELFWDVPSDVDLHVMNPTDQNLDIDNIDIEYPSMDADLESWRERTNIEWWDTGNDGKDCHWRNCKGAGVEWGEPGRGDNPSLDRDDIPGTGPENINISQPKEGWYRVSVHYYSDRENGTDAHIRVYCNGTVAYQNSAFLLKTDYTWLVNDIYWKDLGNNDGQCYIFSDGRIFDDRQGEGNPGYTGTIVEDIEPDNE